jgi:hypothetical protein
MKAVIIPNEKEKGAIPEKYGGVDEKEGDRDPVMNYL